MNALDWPIRQVLRDLSDALEVLKLEQSTVCRYCGTPCPQPPDPACARIRWVNGRLRRMETAYHGLAAR